MESLEENFSDDESFIRYYCMACNSCLITVFLEVICECGLAFWVHTKVKVIKYV